MMEIRRYKNLEVIKNGEGETLPKDTIFTIDYIEEKRCLNRDMEQWVHITPESLPVVEDTLTFMMFSTFYNFCQSVYEIPKNQTKSEL